ncbi:hypothetical protein BKA93DRAFT_747039 [Sparassis latifolia]
MQYIADMKKGQLFKEVAMGGGEPGAVGSLGGNLQKSNLGLVRSLLNLHSAASDGRRPRSKKTSIQGCVQGRKSDLQFPIFWVGMAAMTERSYKGDMVTWALPNIIVYGASGREGSNDAMNSPLREALPGESADLGNTFICRIEGAWSHLFFPQRTANAAAGSWDGPAPEYLRFADGEQQHARIRHAISRVQPDPHMDLDLPKSIPAASRLSSRDTMMCTTSHILLYEDFGYNLGDVVVATDDSIKTNMVLVFASPDRSDSLAWLMQKNGSPFFNTRGLHGDKDDGYDLVVCPLDFQQNGQTVDVLLPLVSPGVPILDSLVDSQHYGPTFASGPSAARTRQAFAIGAVIRQHCNEAKSIKASNPILECLYDVYEVVEVSHSRPQHHTPSGVIEIGDSPRYADPAPDDYDSLWRKGGCDGTTATAT